MIGVLAVMTTSAFVASVLYMGAAFVGLGAIRTSSWVIAGVAGLALVLAFVGSLRLRRPSHLVWVLAACGTALLLTETLISRVV